MFPSEVDWLICWPCTRNTTLDPCNYNIKSNHKGDNQRIIN